MRRTYSGPDSGVGAIYEWVMGIFTSMDKLIGPDFEKGLQRLKADAEKG